MGVGGVRRWDTGSGRQGTEQGAGRAGQGEGVLGSERDGELQSQGTPGPQGLCPHLQPDDPLVHILPHAHLHVKL